MPVKRTKDTENKIVKKVDSSNTKKTSTKKSTLKNDKIIKKDKTVVKKSSPSKKVSSATTTNNKKKSTNIRTKTNKSVKVTKSSSKKAKSNKTIEPKIQILEYYDLPYRYNQTVVKMLAQNPNTLFVYWDISDVDRKHFEDTYGKSFFYDTKPVLVIHNNTMHYSFEIDIDDFANSWYLHVNDSDCEYSVELGRRKKYFENNPINIENNYLQIIYSNKIESPNDHVLFNKDCDTVYFKDVKTNIISKKHITSLSYMRNMGRIYSLYDLQSDFNKNSWMNSNHWQLDLKNPSSSNPTSTFK